MCYIDPPYNTGKDFIYKDNFTENASDYYERTGQSKDGIKLKSNLESNGRYHSDWLTMMYPRLFLAKNLLKDDGVIFVSIDDNEVANLRMIMNEIFGEENFVAQFVWSGGRKNDSKFVSVSHEYGVCYVKSLDYLKAHQIIWRKKKKGLEAIYKTYGILKKKYKDDYLKIQDELGNWYSSLLDTDPSKRHRHYSKVDERGIYFPDNISWPGGGGPNYDVLHPITKKPCAVPSRGWMFGSLEKMKEVIRENRVHFGPDETFVPCIKSYLVDREYSAPYSVFYQDGRAATKRLRELMGGDYFEHPKDELVLKDFVEFITSKEDNDIVLDFFAGSGTTAHAVMDLNVEDGGNRKWISVQIPEETGEASEAYKAGYKNIAEISRKRIRRAGEKIGKGDIGFKSLELSQSSYRQWNVLTDKDDEQKLKDEMKLFVEKPLIDNYDEKTVVYEILTKEGFDINSKVEEKSENKEAIFRTQIKETIRSHFDKQEELGNNIKVLSLFFIDKVDNYVRRDSLIRTIFNEEFEKLKKNYTRFKNIDSHSVHKGYFASKKEKGKVVFQDTRGDSKIDKEAYDLIMKDKERLLSFSEPVSFIFSHSALKEGWDNPNIFQICTLRETISLMKKRQEIGRGLRLPVDIEGNRIYDPSINVLTVIANESYQEYVGQLQAEFTEAGYIGGPEPTDAKQKKITVNTTKHIDTEDFKILWDKISKRTKYNLDVKTKSLIKSSLEKINERDISNLVVTVDKVNIYFDNTGNMQTVFAGQSAGSQLERDIRIQNVIDRIGRETGVTKSTILDILSQVENLHLIFENPEEYIRSVIVIIHSSLNDLLMNEGLKYMPSGEAWEIKLLFKDFEVLSNKSIKSDKSAFTRVVFDGKGEKEFAEHLEGSSNVKVYTKLPRGFTIDTPLGQYIPDWAIVWKTLEGEKLYLVRETKFGYGDFSQELPLNEQQKILCAKKHFIAIGFNDYDTAEQPDLSDLVKNYE